MRIFYISNAVIPSEASRSLSIMRVCQAFSDAGHEVLLDCIAPSGNHPEPVSYYGLKGGFSVICQYFPKLIYNRLTCMFLLGGLLHGWIAKKNIEKFQPDLVYSRLTILEMAFVPRNLPIIYEMHSLGALGKKFWQKAAFLWIMRNRDIKKIVVTTDALSNWLKKEMPWIEITIARLSAEPPVEVSKTKLLAFRKENLLGDFTQNVGYTGFLDTEGLRGTDIICQTASGMPDVAFHIVGGEPEIVKYWKKYAGDWNAAGNIFFYGYRNPAEMPLFLNLFDVVLAPLQFRPNKRAPLGQNMSPLKLPQYMGYGKAIVASDLNSHTEILEHGKTALLVPHNDVGAWRDAIASLLDDPEKRAEMGKAAFNRYTSEFTPEQRIKKILGGIL